MAGKHPRILHYPFMVSLPGALLDDYQEEQHAARLDIRLNLRLLEQTSSELYERDDVIYERVHGNYVPMQIHFSRVSELKNSGFFKRLAEAPPEDPIRTINDMLTWWQPGHRDNFFLFAPQAPTADNLMFFARRLTAERLPQRSTPVTVERDWCCPPPMPGRLVPRPQHLFQRFGGDPITVEINGRLRHRRLFIGGTDVQPERRPHVHAVLNLGEMPSRWVISRALHPGDRVATKGEGPQGMSIAEIEEEANWVIEHLQKGQRVLVHCAAGMNRSVTICCAVLIRLEGLTAEQALARVREHHPWARPDTGHWLRLRWLAGTDSG